MFFQYNQIPNSHRNQGIKVVASFNFTSHIFWFSKCIRFISAAKWESMSQPSNDKVFSQQMRKLCSFKFNNQFCICFSFSILNYVLIWSPRGYAATYRLIVLVIAFNLSWVIVAWITSECKTWSFSCLCCVSHYVFQQKKGQL